MLNSKILNTKFVFLGTRGDTIYECADQQKVLRKEQKSYRKALVQFGGFMDELEGINAFLVGTFSYYTATDSTEEDKLHDWQKRIINLYIQLITDTAIYEDKIDELQEMIDALQAIIDGFCENGSGIGARISYYKTQIAKLIAEIQAACDQIGLEFNYQPINHGSKKVHTIYRQLYQVVMKEYNKMKDETTANDYVDGRAYNEGDAKPTKNKTIADEIANALMNPIANPESTILGISDFANGEEFKFETKVGDKNIDFVEDGVIDAQDVAELTDKINHQDLLTEEEKANYDVNQDGELNKEDIKAASEIIYKQTDDPENTPGVELQNVDKAETPAEETSLEGNTETPNETPTEETTYAYSYTGTI